MDAKPTSDQQNYYELLEISAEAPHHEIVAAYERAKETYSPSSPSLYTMFSEEEAAELRKLIEEAFVTLSNQAKRREYDKVLKNKNQSSAPASDITSTTALSGKPSTSAGSSTTPPQGFSKNKLTVYEVKPEFEKEISLIKDYDGSSLQKIRQYKNISIEQMSKETRISRSYLMALEANDYENLPAAVFTRGFVVQVARLLSLDDVLVAQTYMNKFKKK